MDSAILAASTTGASDRGHPGRWTTANGDRALGRDYKAAFVAGKGSRPATTTFIGRVAYLESKSNVSWSRFPP